MDKGFKYFEYLVWITAIISGAMGLTAFGYNTFATKETVHEIKSDITSRFDRLEQKVDLLLEMDK